MLPRSPELTKSSATLLITVPLFSALLVTSAVTARFSMSSEVDHIVSRGIAPMSGPNGGVAVAVQMGGRSLFFNYGYADQAEKRPVTSDSLFNVGSVRKMFEADFGGARRAARRAQARRSGGEICHRAARRLHPARHRPPTGQSHVRPAAADRPSAVADREIFARRVLRRAERLDAVGRRSAWQAAHLYPCRLYPASACLGAPLRQADRRAARPRRDRAARHDIDARAGTRRRRPRHHECGSCCSAPSKATGATASRSGFPAISRAISIFRERARCSRRRTTSHACSPPASARSQIDPQLRQALLATQREEFRVSPQYGQAMAWEIENPFGVTIVDKPGGLDNASAYVGLVPDRKIGIAILVNRGDVHRSRSPAARSCRNWRGSCRRTDKPSAARRAK